MLFAIGFLTLLIKRWRESPQRELNVWDGPEDNIVSMNRKLRERGTDGKAAETAALKKRKKTKG